MGVKVKVNVPALEVFTKEGAHVPEIGGVLVELAASVGAAPPWHTAAIGLKVGSCGALITTSVVAGVDEQPLAVMTSV